MAKIIALYLPQFYPTKENDEWWGPGFTDWRTVNLAKPLFKGHSQPKYPADLGYYDLRVTQTRIEQARLAKEAGIAGFCYWHYWFGGGRRLLNNVFDEVIESQKPDFPFCLGWANHSWYKKAWGGKGKDQLLIEQTYPGTDDYILHFQTMLPAFRDKRYLKQDGRLIYLIYVPLASPEIKIFIETWQRLAKESDLNGFFFIGKTSYSANKNDILELGFDAIYNDNLFGILHREGLIKKGMRFVIQKLLHKPMVFKYKDAIKYMLSSEEEKEEIIPTIAPNWDHSPRSGVTNPIFINTNPKYFKKLVKEACKIVAPKKNQIVILKSWNEWGEGNYMEPDLEWGHGYLEALRQGKDESQY
ncbi:MAG: glycoside hydrolase family 99-like domain-containing protein [Muribaculaceae bacterium]|nr:glycoside hydrolase family 99-like domain-containing protein [Muribaculaceae bacterium]